MKILLINAYSNGSHSIEFKELQKIIQQFFKEQHTLVDTEVEFFNRDLSNMDDFLFSRDSNFTQGAQQFDNIDLAFIEGNANLRPWGRQSKKILIFLKMCLQTQKCLFASNGIMHFLIYLLATDLNSKVQFANGADGSNLEKIKQ